VNGYGHSIDLLETWSYVDGDMPKPPAKLVEPEVILTGLWGWISRRLGVEPWRQGLIVGLVVLFSAGFIFIWSFNNRLTALETKSNNLPNELADRVDAKLANLRADLIKEFLSEAKKFTAAGDFGHASQAVQAAVILTASARERRELASPEFFESAIVELTSIKMNVRPGPSVLSQPIHNAFVALAGCGKTRKILD
jgi:hypothetical protein